MEKWKVNKRKIKMRQNERFKGMEVKSNDVKKDLKGKLVCITRLS